MSPTFGLPVDNKPDDQIYELLHKLYLEDSSVSFLAINY